VTVADNDTHLAKLTQVSRRTIYKMRERGAPTGVVLEQWLQWLKRQPRTAKYVAALVKYLAKHGDVGGGKTGTSGAKKGPPAAGVVITVEDLGPIERMKYDREAVQLDNARRVQAQLDKDLLKQSDVVAAVRRFGSRTVSALKDAIWLEIVPLLDGCPPALVKRLRKAHDAAVRKVRGRIVRAVDTVLADLIEED